MTITQCPHCNMMTIEIREIPNTILIKRGYTGKKGKQFFRGKDIYLTKVCPNCGKNPQHEEINNEKIRKRLKESGMPTQIEE